MESSEHKVRQELEEVSHIDTLAAERDDDFSNDDLYNISSYGADFSFREIVTMYKDGDLLKPELQRHYVWEKPEASRFVESLLLGLPVPSVFFAKKKDSKFLIVDGYQRVKTVNDYTEGKPFSDSEKVFKLSNTEKINKRWRGKAFKELTQDDQRRIKTALIHTIIFEQKKPENDDTGMYQIFERINTGGRTLMPQEIRNCIYSGPLNNLLKELNSDTNWRKLFGREKEDSRMRDREFLLRFFALQDPKIRNQHEGQISLKKHLNDFMSANEKIPEDRLAEFRSIFPKAMEFIYSHFGETAFQNIRKDSIGFTGKFHPTVFEAISISASIALAERPNADYDKSELLAKREALLKSSEFQIFITERTTELNHINGRISAALNQLFGLKHE